MPNIITKTKLLLKENKQKELFEKLDYLYFSEKQILRIY